ncbi:MAG: dihydrolipoamide acetyltransferase family protein [Planctomycetota bacterium]|nr:dihydrolipoamide acetyltransferase family protein [Planctomycetota bacterium]
MIHKLTLPKLGETVEVSTIDKWLKAEGDPVAVGDVLCEITTDKATLEVESYHRGTLLRIIAPTGKELPVGTLIAVIGDAGEKIPADILAQAGEAPAAAKTAKAAAKAAAAPAPAGALPAATGGRLVASPRARRAAKELRVDLSRICGTGPGGRIVEADVRAAAKAARDVKASPVARKVAARMGVDLASVAPAAAGGKVMKEHVLRAAAAGPAAPAPAPGKPGEVVPLSAMRRIVAERMLLSKQTIPCYYLEMDADVTDLVCLRNKMNARQDAQKVTFNDFIVKACAAALRAFPPVNSRWVEGGIERRAEVNVGFAVALDEGLVVPVVRSVDRKSLAQVAAEAAGLVERARSKRLQPDEYQGGCLTISNLGMYGIRSFIPVVNPGESTILGLGMIEDRVVFRQGGIQVRKIMTLTLAGDHRIVDGAVGAQFLEAIRDALEAPAKLVE